MDVDAQAMEACRGYCGDRIMGEVFNNILVIQTAFIGDAILTLPLVQVLKKNHPSSSIDIVVVPRTAEIFSNHPALYTIISYDKHGIDKGIIGLLRLRTILHSRKYDLIIVPHRSFRSAFLTWSLKPTMSIGFDRSAGRCLFTENVHYDPTVHEIERNLLLLGPLKIKTVTKDLPRLYPSSQDVLAVDSVLNKYVPNKRMSLIAVAPAIVLVGSKEDEVLCSEIIELSLAKNIFNFAGMLPLLQSAELIRRSKVLISNDSAPMHLAVAVGTPVIAIFGATVPEFGFTPCGPRDIVVETEGLKCRPCAIHGGKTCPIGTFECMLNILPDVVVDKVKPFLQ
jgi:heptosyltransferase-2